MDIHLLIIILALIFSALFSGMEIAFLSANKLRLELQSQKGNLNAVIINKFVSRPSGFLTTILVGNNIALVVYGIYMALVIETLILSWHLAFQQKFIIFLAQTIIGSIVVLVFAEFLPKAIFRLNPDKLIRFFAIPFKVLYYIFLPLTLLAGFLSGTILSVLFKIKSDVKKKYFNRYDLFHMIEENLSGDTDQGVELDTQIFKNALEFPDVKLRECIVPRTEIIAVEINDALDDVRLKFVDSGHSKIIVYENSLDNILGFVHLIDVFGKPKSIKEILRPILISTESMPASELLKLFIDKRRSISVVVDEFGGTSGIVTIEDIIEEIFGEIEDEHDQEEFVERQLSENSFVFSARLEIDYINEKYETNLPVGEYETLGGLILNYAQKIPERGETINIDNFDFKILSVGRTRIYEVMLTIHEE